MPLSSDEQRPERRETQVVCCPRRPVSSFPPGFIAPRLYEKNLEHNQLVASCCRHPENHEIEARKSRPEEPVPDIYVFYCSCGRAHRVFCVGALKRVKSIGYGQGLVQHRHESDVRPEWQ